MCKMGVHTMHTIIPNDIVEILLPNTLTLFQRGLTREPTIFHPTRYTISILNLISKIMHS